MNFDQFRDVKCFDSILLYFTDKSRTSTKKGIEEKFDSVFNEFPKVLCRAFFPMVSRKHPLRFPTSPGTDRL